MPTNDPMIVRTLELCTPNSKWGAALHLGVRAGLHCSNISRQVCLCSNGYCSRPGVDGEVTKQLQLRGKLTQNVTSVEDVCKHASMHVWTLEPASQHRCTLAWPGKGCTSQCVVISHSCAHQTEHLALMM